MRYKTPRALEMAVKSSARKTGRDVSREIAGFWRDRLLCRIFESEKPKFLLKGGQGMLARIPGARETRDLDFVATTSDLDEALEELKATASRDLGDFVSFRFEQAAPTDTSQDYRQGYTATFSVWLGGTAKRGTVSVDLVVDTMPPEEYDVVDPVSRLKIDGLVTRPYLLTTVETRIAEKVGATLQDYNGRQSSRVKDLADLATMMLNETPDGGKLARRIRMELAIRKINKADGFVVPNEWRTVRATNYRQIAKESHLPKGYEDVSATADAVAAWLAPVFSGEAEGKRWDPKGQSWE